MSDDWLRLQWMLFALVWFVSAALSKRTVRREPPLSGLVHMSLLAFAWLLLFQPWGLGPLNDQSVPANGGVLLCGIVLTALGLAFAIWARLRLGRNWSGTVTIKENHRLVYQGPYRIVRHPIYFGILVAMAGTAIGYGGPARMISVPVAFLALWIKSRMEERFMVAQFGEQYLQYQRKVKSLIPGVL